MDRPRGPSAIQSPFRFSPPVRAGGARRHFGRPNPRRRNASFPGTSLSPATLLTQVIVLPGPVVAGWLVQRHGYGVVLSLAACFMAVGALVIRPVRLYRGVGWPPA